MGFFSYFVCVAHMLPLGVVFKSAQLTGTCKSRSINVFFNEKCILNEFFL